MAKSTSQDSFKDELTITAIKAMGLPENSQTKSEQRQDDGYKPPQRAKHMLIHPEVKYMVDVMTDKQAGMLFKSLLSFFVDGEIPIIDDNLVMATFNQCRDKIIENNERYIQKCIKNHQNRKGGFNNLGEWVADMPEEEDIRNC